MASDPSANTPPLEQSISGMTYKEILLRFLNNIHELLYDMFMLTSYSRYEILWYKVTQTSKTSRMNSA